MHDGVVWHEPRDSLPLGVASIAEHHVQLRRVRVIKDDPFFDAQMAAGDARARGDRNVGSTEDERACCEWKPRVAQVNVCHCAKGSSNDQRRVTGSDVEDVCDDERHGLRDLERWAGPNERAKTLKHVVTNSAVADTRRTVEVWSHDFEASVVTAHSRRAHIVERRKVCVEGMQHAAVVGACDSHDVFKVGERRSEVVYHERQSKRRNV